MTTIKRMMAGPNAVRLLMNVFHSLKSAPMIMIINKIVDIFVAVISNKSAKVLFLEH